MKKFSVYQHISPNGKKYIGITSQPVKRRWKNGTNYRNNPHFTHAIEKYGWDNFKHEVIATGLSKSDAEAIEVELIEKYDTTNPQKGYNITKGGNVRDKFTPETRLKISKSREKYRGKNHPRYGIKLSEETKLKISQANYKGGRKPKPKKGYFTKPVRCITTGEIFPSIKAANEKFGITISSIGKVCSGKMQHAGKLNGIPLKWEFIVREVQDTTNYNKKADIEKGGN